MQQFILICFVGVFCTIVKMFEISLDHKDFNSVKKLIFKKMFILSRTIAEFYEGYVHTGYWRAGRQHGWGRTSLAQTASASASATNVEARGRRLAVPWRNN